MIKEYYRRIKRIFQYAWYVVKYADHDWDYFYLLKLIEMKLGWMQQSIANGHLVNSKKRAKEIQIAKELVKRINSDKYHDMYETFDADKIEYGNNEDKLFTMNLSRAIEPKTNLPITLDRLQTPNNENKDLQYLCNWLNKKLFRWWD